MQPRDGTEKEQEAKSRHKIDGDVSNGLLVFFFLKKIIVLKKKKAVMKNYFLIIRMQKYV